MEEIDKEENNKESKDDKKKEGLSKKEEKKRQKEEKEAKKKEEKLKKEELKRQKKLAKKSGHMKLKSSGQLLPSNIHNFDFVINKLPDSFFEDVLLNEMELSEEFSIEKLMGLIRLYSQAMEFYLQNDPPKAKYYQGRMEFLLTNKDTLKKLKKQSESIVAHQNLSNNVSNRATNINLENSLKNTKLNLSKAEMKKNIEFQTDNLIFDNISQKVNEVIGDNNAKGDIQTAKSIIEGDLKKQNESWKEKLKMKKKNALRNTMENKGIGLESLKGKSTNLKSSTDEKLNIGGKKLEKMKYMFTDDIYEEVKEENEGEGSDNEEEKNDKKEQIIDNLDDINIINIDNEEKLKAEQNKKEENDKDNKNENKENKKIEKAHRKKSIVDEVVIPTVEIDDNILNSVNQRMDLLMKLIDDIEKNKVNEGEDDEIDYMESSEDKNNDNKNEIIEDKKEKKGKNLLSDIHTDVINVPVKFQSTYYQLESIMQSYMDEFNSFFYKDIFEQFASKLKEIYDNKYKKYIEISVEYHHHIKENEHILENTDNLSEEKKEEIQQIIDSLKDEQQNQIAKIEDEFNRLIVSKVNEFKINSFKNNSGIQLMEEQLKLDIYSLITESFY